MTTETLPTHTPGPWACVSREERDGVAWDVVEVKTGTIIARNVAADPRHYGETPRTANARLMASAPDLLDACRAIVDLWGIQSSSDKFVQQLRDSIDDARNAIAKAVNRK